jgi:TPP-dependent indolepyruvate ferredoxin oxidoreductase alpha subunit
MYGDVYDLILSFGPRLVYTAGLSEGAKKAPPGVHFESCVNEKAAYEMALAGAYAAKKTACLFSAEGVYEALDPLMSSAYTGVKGGMVVVCVKEGALDVTPLGPFSKLPVLVSDGTAGDLASALAFAFDLSARYEMPCLVETLPPKGRRRPKAAGARTAGTETSVFTKDTGRWAAIPKFRYQLHKALNAKIKRIREEFETYGGNVRAVKGARGVLTHRACTDPMPAGASVLALGSVFPLPVRLVAQFAEGMDDVRVIEGGYPAIEVQLRAGGMDGRLRRCGAAEGATRPKAAARESLFGLTVVRDRLGPASSINIAHGMAKAGVKDLLALTDADAFLHSGLPAFVNVIYNGSDYLLAIKTNGREKEIAAALRGFGFDRISRLASSADIRKYRDDGRLTVLFHEGDL